MAMAVVIIFPVIYSPDSHQSYNNVWSHIAGDAHEILHMYDMTYDMMNDWHWKTARQAASNKSIAQTCEMSERPSDHLSQCQLCSSTKTVLPSDPCQLSAHPALKSTRCKSTGRIKTIKYDNKQCTIYEGLSINKLQNSVILLVFQILKIQNIRFVGNSILSSSYDFCADDVIVTSFINIKYSDVATEIIP